MIQRTQEVLGRTLRDYARVIRVLARTGLNAVFEHFRYVDQDLFCPDTPFRPGVVAVFAFPDGSAITSGLRRVEAWSSLLVGLPESNGIRGRRMRFATPAPARAL
jgi:hypothetical protein